MFDKRFDKESRKLTNFVLKIQYKEKDDFFEEDIKDFEKKMSELQKLQKHDNMLKVYKYFVDIQENKLTYYLIMDRFEETFKSYITTKLKFKLNYFEIFNFLDCLIK